MVSVSNVIEIARVEQLPGPERPAEAAASAAGVVGDDDGGEDVYLTRQDVRRVTLNDLEEINKGFQRRRLADAGRSEPAPAAVLPPPRQASFRPSQPAPSEAGRPPSGGRRPVKRVRRPVRTRQVRGHTPRGHHDPCISQFYIADQIADYVTNVICHIADYVTNVIWHIAELSLI